MDFLLDNPLATMDGLAFLVVYIPMIILAAVAAGIARSNADQTDQLSIPAIPPDPDPYEIAFLRGGANETARSLIFSLIKKGLVEIVTSDKMSLLKPVTVARVTGLSNIERTAMDWLGMSRDSSEVFGKKNGLVEEIEPFVSIYRERLESRQLLNSFEGSRRLRKIGIVLILGIVLLGGYRIFVAIAFGHFNIAFTIIAMVIGFFVIGGITTLPRMTKLGKQYLLRLQIAFDDLKYKAQAPYIRSAEPKAIQQAGFTGIDPLLLSVGLFGSGVLAGTMFDGYNAAFKKSEQQQGSGGCGSGSACGSGCSSSSDGGGSSCGSGCGGGCGGGGCGG